MSDRAPEIREKRGYLQAWADVRAAAEAHRASGYATPEFLEGMILGASNALWLSYKSRFGEDPTGALEQLEDAGSERDDLLDRMAT